MSHVAQMNMIWRQVLSSPHCTLGTNKDEGGSRANRGFSIVDLFNSPTEVTYNGTNMD